MLSVCERKRGGVLRSQALKKGETVITSFGSALGEVAKFSRCRECFRNAMLMETNTSFSHLLVSDTDTLSFTVTLRSTAMNNIAKGTSLLANNRSILGQTKG